MVGVVENPESRSIPVHQPTQVHADVQDCNRADQWEDENDDRSQKNGDLPISGDTRIEGLSTKRKYFLPRLGIVGEVEIKEDANDN